MITDTLKDIFYRKIISLYKNKSFKESLFLNDSITESNKAFNNYFKNLILKDKVFVEGSVIFNGLLPHLLGSKSQSIVYINTKDPYIKTYIVNSDIIDAKLPQISILLIGIHYKFLIPHNIDYDINQLYNDLINQENKRIM